MNHCARCGNDWTDKRIHCPKCGLERCWKSEADRIREMSNEELALFLYDLETTFLPIGLHVENTWPARLRREVE